MLYDDARGVLDAVEICAALQDKTKDPPITYFCADGGSGPT